jgi:TonB family protein
MKDKKMLNYLKCTKMKKILVFLAGMLITFIATSQNQVIKEVKVTPPNFKGEIPVSLIQYVQERVEYPSIAINGGVHGTVVVGFVITPQGELRDFEVINSVSKAIDDEVIRVLKTTNGKWAPGTRTGEAVSMPHEVSVVFKLYAEDDFTKIAKKYFNKANETLFVKDQPEKALKFINRGMNYMPNDETLLAVRGLCKYRLGDEMGANRDWGRLKILASREDSNTQFKDLAEYLNNPGVPKEFISFIQEIQN